MSPRCAVPALLLSALATTQAAWSDPLFELVTTPAYETGTSPIAVVAEDLDGDGHADLVVANQSSNTISIFRGNGDGTFQTRVDLPTGIQPSAIATGDLDGDGYPDIVVCNGNSSVSVFLHGPSGYVSSSLSVGSGSVAVTLVDLDQDYHLDIVTATGGWVAIWWGVGDGTFFERTDIPCGPTLKAIAVGDLDLDGNLDLVVSRQPTSPGRIVVLRGLGDHAFVQVQDFASSAQAVRLMRLNGDAYLDLLTPGSAYRGYGNGMFLTSSYPTKGSQPLFLADLDGDLVDEVLGLYPGSNLVSVCRRADTSYVEIGDQGTGTFVDGFAAAELTGDGFADLAFVERTTNRLRVLPGNGDGTFLGNHTGNGPTALAIEDLNGDGLRDVVVTERTYDFANVFLGTGGGGFAEGQRWSTAAPGPTKVLAGDLDGDGDVDMLTLNSASSHLDPPSSMTILTNGGSANFSRADIALAAKDAALGDVTGDGILDLVCIVNATYQVAVGNGTGGFTPLPNVWLGPTTIQRAVRLGDFDQDGVLDAAMLAEYLRVLRGQGDGTFEIIQVQSIGPSSNADLEIGDLDGDGLLDAVVPTDAGARWFKGRADGQLDPGVDIPGDGQVYSVEIADVNQAAGLDLVLETGNNEFGIRLGHNDGTFDPAWVLATGAWSTARATLGDLTGDGRNDVVVILSSNEFVVYRNLTVPVADVEGPSVALTPSLRMAIQPNPIHGPFQVTFDLPERASEVHVHVFDLAGRRVASETMGDLPAGKHWATVNTQLRPGIHMVEVRTPTARAVARACVIR